MDLAILQAWAIAVGGLSSMGAALIVLMLLNRASGPGSAFAFASAYFGAYTTIGAIVVFGAGQLFELDTSSQAKPGPSIALCVLGLLIATAAVKQWRSPPSDEPPSLFAKLDEFQPLKAFAVGALIPAINFKNLAIYLPAVAVLAGAGLEPPIAALAVVSTAVIFCGGLLTPCLIYALIPGRAATWLAAMREWIEANSSMVARIILPIIACLLLAKGGLGLWSLYGP